MCKRIDTAKKLIIGRLFVGNTHQLDNGPVTTRDTVAIEMADDITFYIKVSEIHGSDIQGILVAIGRNPVTEWETWKLGDSVVVDDEYVSAVIRGD